MMRYHSQGTHYITRELNVIRVPRMKVRADAVHPSSTSICTASLNAPKSRPTSTAFSALQATQQPPNQG